MPAESSCSQPTGSSDYRADAGAAHRLCRVVWKILHEGARFIEKGREPDAQAKKRRARILVQALRRLGYDVAITATHLATQNAMQA
jgi:hypothetical protein